MSLELSQIIAKSNITFGTSGARGLVSDFNSEVCAAFAQSFIKVMKKNYNFNRVALAIDNRPSSETMAASCIGALQALGLEVDYYGVIPTPALAYKSMQDKIPAIMVTGSHIPFDRNGLKFYRPDGEISKSDEIAILSVIGQLIFYKSSLPLLSTSAAESYIKRYTDFFPSNLLQGKRIGIYEHSSAGRDLYHKVFRELGAEVFSLNRTNTFVPIDTEAVTPEDKKKGLGWSALYALDMIFSTDGDGDRPLIADEKGRWIRGDIVGLLCAKSLGIPCLAVPVSCNSAIEHTGFFNQVERTKIGSPYVIAAFRELFGTVAGFEANGGFLLGSDVLLGDKVLKALPTRDALLPALALMSLAGKQPLSHLVDRLPQRYTASDRLQQVDTNWSNSFLSISVAAPRALLTSLGLQERKISHVNNTDGLRLHFIDGDIVHLRPSGNAPELRVYAESNSEQNVEALLGLVLGQLKKIVNYIRKPE